MGGQGQPLEDVGFEDSRVKDLDELTDRRDPLEGGEEAHVEGDIFHVTAIDAGTPDLEPASRPALRVALPALAELSPVTPPAHAAPRPHASRPPGHHLPAPDGWARSDA